MKRSTDRRLKRWDDGMSLSEMINGGQPFLYRDHGALGFTRSEFRVCVDHGDVVRLVDRVYADARVADTRELRVGAARLVVPGHAVICDETAAWLWGVDAHRPIDRHRFTPRWVVPHGRGRTRLDGIDCRQALIDDEDITEIDGLAITTPLRTTSDLLRKQWRPHALASADAMARANLVRPMDVRQYLTGLKGYRGIRQARVLARYIEPKSASPGESWTRLRLIDAGFPVPAAQVEVVDASGITRFLDLAYRRRKIGAEFDGREFHSGVTDVEHDTDRRHLIRAMGYRLVVARYEDVFGSDTSFEDEIGALLGMTPIGRWW